MGLKGCWNEGSGERAGEIGSGGQSESLESESDSGLAAISNIQSRL